MKRITTGPDIPALKIRILDNLIRMEARGKKIIKKHRDAAAKKLAEILQ